MEIDRTGNEKKIEQLLQEIRAELEQLDYDADVVWKKIAEIEESYNFGEERSFEREIDELRSEVEKYENARHLKNLIEGDIEAGDLTSARSKMIDLEAATGDRDKQWLENTERRIKEIEIRIQGKSVHTKLKDPGIISAHDLINASRSAANIENFRIAYNNIWQLFVISNDESERTQAEAQANDYRARFIAKLEVDVRDKIAQAENRKRTNHFKQANDFLDIAEKLGNVPDQIAGGIQDYLGQVELPAELIDRIAALRGEIKDNQETFNKSKQNYDEAFDGYKSNTPDSIAHAINLLESVNFNFVSDDYNLRELLPKRQREFLREKQTRLRRSFDEALRSGNLAEAEKSYDELLSSEYDQDILKSIRVDCNDLKERIQKSNSYQSRIKELFEQSKNEINNADRSEVERNLELWRGVALSKDEVADELIRIRNFYDQELPQLSGYVLEFQKELRNRPINEIRLAEYAEFLESNERYKYRKVANLLSDYYFILTDAFRQKNEYENALDAANKAKRYSIYASDDLRSDRADEIIAQLIRDNEILARRQSTENKLLDFEKELHSDPEKKETYYRNIQALLNDPETIGLDPKFKVIYDEANRYLRNMDFEATIAELDAVLNATPIDLVAAKTLLNRAERLGSDLRIDTFGQKIVSVESNSEDLRNEAAQLYKDDNYLKLENVIKVSEESNYYTTDLQNLFQRYKQEIANWKSAQGEGWTAAKEKAKEFVNQEEYDNAIKVLNPQTTTFFSKSFMPLAYYQTIRELIEEPRRKADVIKKRISQSEEAEVAGNISLAQNCLPRDDEALPSVIRDRISLRREALTERARSISAIHRAVFISDVDSLRYRFENLFSKISNESKIDSDLLRGINNVLNRVKTEGENLERSYAAEMQANYHQQIRLRTDQIEHLFSSDELQTRLERYDKPFTIFYRIADWLFGFDIDVDNGKVEARLQSSQNLLNQIDKSFVNERGWLLTLQDWLEKRKEVREIFDAYKSRYSSFNPFSQLNKNSEILKSLAAKILTPSEQGKADALAEKLQIESKKAVLKFWLAWILMFAALGFIIWASRQTYYHINPTPTFTSTPVTPTITSTPTSTATVTYTPTITLTPTPIPTAMPLSGEMLLTSYLRKFPGKSGLIFDGALAVVPGEYVKILRYCDYNENGVTQKWVMIELDDTYAWFSLRDDRGLPMVSIEGYNRDPELKLTDRHKVDCAGLYTPVPGLPTPASW